MSNEHYKIMTFYENLNTKEIAIKSDNKLIKLDFHEIFDFCIMKDEYSKMFLERLFESTNYDYIDNSTWFTFLVSSKTQISPISERFLYTNFDKLNSYDFSVQNNGRNTNTTINKTDYDNNVIIKNTKNPKMLFPISERKSLLEEQLSDSNFNLISEKTIFTNKSKYEISDMLISFLHCVFTSKRKYCLKKCDICDRYYLTTETDSKYCKRITKFNDKDITCAKKSMILKKTYQYLQMNKKHTNFLHRLNNNKYVSLEYIDNYKKRYKEAMKQYLKTNDISILKDFINNYENNYPIN